MGSKGKAKKKARLAAAAAAADAAVNSNEPPVDFGAAANGDGIPSSMPASFEPANGGEPTADSASAASIGDEIAPQPPSVEAAHGDELPLDSAVAANKDAVPSPPPFSVEAPNGDKTPVNSAAEPNGDVIPLQVDSAAEANGDVVEQSPLVEADIGGSEKNNAPIAAAAAASTDAAVNGDEPPVGPVGAANGDGMAPPMPTSVEQANGGEPPTDSTAAATIGDEVATQSPSLAVINGDGLPLDSVAEANNDGVPPTPPFLVEAPKGDKTPVHSAAEANRDVIPLPVDSAAESNGDVVKHAPSVEADNGGSEPTAETGLVEDSSEERRDSSLEREGEVEKLKAINGMLVKEAVETRGQVAALASLMDERSADAGAVAIVEREVFRTTLVSPLRASTEEDVTLRARLADDQELLQAAEARAAREADARLEAAARIEEAAPEERRILDLLCGKEAEAAAATKTVTGLEAVVSELAGKSTELCSEKGELEKQLGETSSSVHNIRVQKTEVEGSFRDYRMNSERYKQEMEDKLGEKSKQLEALRSSKAEMELKYQSLESQLSAAVARNRELELEMETSKAELAAAKTELEKLLVEIADVGEKHTTVVAEADSLRNEINKMMTTKEAAVSALAIEKTKLEKELDRMKRKVDLCQHNKDTAMASVRQKDVEASKLRAELNGLCDSIAEQRALCEKLRAKNSSLQGEVDTVQKALGDEKAAGDKLRLMLGEVENYSDEKEREVTVLKAELRNKRGDIYTLDGEVKKLQLAVAKAKKSGVWTWLCPTTTVIAAASFAYAARSR